MIFTIHQPRSNIVALFDRLILLAQGYMVYSGPASTCQQYFDKAGYPCPPGFNIADFLVDLTMHAGASRSHVEEFDPTPSTGDRPKTASSSMRAVKSIASTSDTNTETNNNISGSAGSAVPSSRPENKRRLSLKQKQDRQLYSRKKDADLPPTPKTNDDGEDVFVPNRNQQWLQMLRQPETITAAATPAEEPDNPVANAPGMQTDLDLLVSKFAMSDINLSIQDEIATAIQNAAAHSPNGGGALPSEGRGKSYARIGLFAQFVILSKRTGRNLYRNPMLMLTHLAISILLSVLCGYLFYGLTDDIKGFQNRLGLFFFILALFGFSTLTSLTVFSTERRLFVRERANGYYHPSTYFAAKVLFDIVPLRLVPPIIMGVIVYPMTGLIPAWPEFFRFMLVLLLFNLAAANICLFIGIVFQDGGIANLIGSLVMLFSLLFAGLLLNREAIPKAALWLQSVGKGPTQRNSINCWPC